jgi:hypothetical protein
MNPSNPQKISMLGHTSDPSPSLLKICQERKQLGISALSNWKQNTHHDIQVSSEFIEELFLRLEKLLEESSKRFNAIAKFLENLSLSIKTDMSFNQNMKLYSLDRDRPFDSLLGKQWENVGDSEPMLFALLNLNWEYEVFAQNLRDLRTKIKTTIVDSLLSKDIEPYEKTVAQLKSQSREKSRILNKKTLISEDKQKKFEKAKQEDEADVSKNKRVRKNIFDSAFEFTEGVKQVETELSHFGFLLIANWDQCKALEAKRISAIRSSLAKFLEIMKEVFGDAADKSFKNRYLILLIIIFERISFGTFLISLVVYSILK